MTKADLGLIGLAVMGQNLVLNANDHGFTVAVNNRTVEKIDEFLQGPAKGTKVIGCHSLKELVQSLKTPRKVMTLVKAGKPVDEIISQVAPLLSKGDIIIDGGNSHFTDTERRCEELKAKGILFVGCGVSGGEEGARHGPSMMPGGNYAAWKEIKPILQAIAAKTDKGEPCCDWVGNGGAGHYVKMVHNGIEYGDIQLICESYHMLHMVLGCPEDEMVKIFKEWNKGELDSYLIEIAAVVLGYKDTDGKPLVRKILDVAGQKGTGKWTGQSALDLAIAVPLIVEAVFARCLSAAKDERVKMSKIYKTVKKTFTGNKNEVIEHIRKALYASKIISYAQGYMLMKSASEAYHWDLNYGGIALMWRQGCIIRSRFLGDIQQAFKKDPKLSNLLADPFFVKAITTCEASLRKAVVLGLEHEVAAPCFTSALAFFDGLKTENLPQNLLQGLRDCFGAHTYERTDQPRGQFFHTNWTGEGGSTSSTSYNA